MANTGIILWGVLSEYTPKDYQTGNISNRNGRAGSMKTRFLVSLLTIIPLAGTLVRCVPSPRATPLSTPRPQIARKALLARLKRAPAEFATGNFRQAAAIAEQGYRDALRAREIQSAARFLNNAGGCRFALHQYQGALQAFMEARRLAEESGDNATAAKLDLNISSLYSELRQMDAAIESAKRAMGRLSGDDRTRQLPAWLIHLAHLYADQHRMPEAVAFYQQGIAAADRAGDQATIADGWDDLGFDYLDRHELPQAERALLQAYRIRKLNHLRSIEGSYRNIGILRFEQGDMQSASRLLDRAVDLSRQPGGLEPAWEVYHARGRVRLAERRLPDALDDFRIAARLARTWRRAALPDDATRVSTENLVQKVHTSLVEAGNQLYFETGRRALAQETFESAEANRAASLRALLAEPRDWRRNLPAEYWETLQKLESAEVDLVRGQTVPVAAAERVQQLRGALIQLESRAGANTDVEMPDLLEHTRRSLRPDAVFFAFHLASPDSYLWAVSRDRFALYRLPPGPQIAGLVDRLLQGVRQGNLEAQATGSQLFRMLFGQLDPAFQAKPRWLLALDAQLFELPFAALVVETRTHGAVYLAERHSVQIVSGAGMLLPPGGDRAGSYAGPFLGIADPVYNTADPRWTGGRPRSFFGLSTALAGDSAVDDLQLARLAGSARETEECAAAWGGSHRPVLLEGASASRDRLQTELHSHPAVLHFATHVLHSGQGPRSGLIVLSLTRTGQHQVLSPVEIATWNLDGALVSLSGCSSGSADALPGTGLMGLTRACQAAGARAVVASRWPTPDDSGSFSLFLSFYRYLRASPDAGPAVALQRAQIDMLQSATWRATPAYWGAYFVTGNRQ
jgi:CHAT domain-containing protein